MIYTLHTANISAAEQRLLVQFAADLPVHSELLSALRRIANAIARGEDITLVTATFAGTEPL